MNESKQFAFPRRQFLRGAGGASLVLPFLPSLASREAEAAQIANARLSMVTIGTWHGGIYFDDMFPMAAATQSTQILPGHTIKHGPLPRTVNGSRASICPVLTADSSKLTARLVGKMNVLSGLDIPFYISHHSGGMLGNYGERITGLEQRPTIDQLIGWSPNFYGAQDPMKKRVIVGPGGGNMSFHYADPIARSGAVQAIARDNSSKKLFNTLFMGSMAPPPGQVARPLIVDRVLANYTSLRQSNRRLSGNDRLRLDAHIVRLEELQRRIDNDTPPVRNCSDIQAPSLDSEPLMENFTDPAKAKQFYGLWNDVVSAAIICGYSRLATLSIGATFQAQGSNWTSWHQDVAHMAGGDPVKEQLLTIAAQGAFEFGFVDLMTKLDVDAGNGRTVLDDTLLVWTQESGRWTHGSASIPIVTAGGAAGFFKTGNFVDYANRVTKSQFIQSNHQPEPGGYAGLLYNRWLATVLQAMRIPKAQWEIPNYYGYGIYGSLKDGFDGKYVPGAVESSNDPLPIIV